MRTHRTTTQPIQLPLPLIQTLPYMGDTRTCHHWDMSDTQRDPDFILDSYHYMLTRELELPQ